MFLVIDTAQELLLHEKTVDLQKAVDICHVRELTSKQTKKQKKWQGHTLIKRHHHISVGETGGNQHSQDKQEESSLDKKGRQDCSRL